MGGWEEVGGWMDRLWLQEAKMGVCLCGRGEEEEEEEKEEEEAEEEEEEGRV